MPAAGNGLADTLDALLTPMVPLGPPLNYDEPGDANVPVGETWVEAPYLTDFQVNPYRSRSLIGWQVQSYLASDTSLSTQMGLFWLNHFGAGREGDTRIFYAYLRILERHALGNFRTLTEEVTVSSQMLRFLDGRFNSTLSPNENYGREFLELFTVGKGPQVAAGDYTTYTEQDVRALSRAFTGWRHDRSESSVPGHQPRTYFQAGHQDDQPKQLSHRFGGAVIAPSGADEYKVAIATVLAQPGAGRHLVRKLYRWFVDYRVGAEVEATVIEPLAQLLADSDWEVAPVLRRLLGSAHFFDARHRGALIKNPFEFVCDLHRGLGFAPAEGLVKEYFFNRRLTWLCDLQNMKVGSPPSVAGWKAYYQAPLYHRTWINAATLQERTRVACELVKYGVFYDDGTNDRLRLLDFVARLDDPLDVDALLDGLAERFLPVGLSAKQRTTLKSFLIPGLPDFEWTAEYQRHLDDPGDTELAEVIETKLRRLTIALVTSGQSNLK